MKKKINSQSTVVHSYLMKTKNHSPTPFQDKGWYFRDSVVRVGILNFISYGLSKVLTISQVQTLHPYMKNLY
jgi:hypothetical protein